MLFSVETQTTEERTQQYQSEVESIYKDLTAKGKALMLSTELGVRFVPTVNRKHFGFFFGFVLAQPRHSMHNRQQNYVQYNDL